MNQNIFVIVQIFIGALLTFGFGWLNKKMDRAAVRQERARQEEQLRQEQQRLAEQAKQEQLEKERRELMVLILQSTTTNRSLSRATAIAIKNGRCNGEVKGALEEAERIDKKQAEYLQKVGVRQVL